MLTEIRGGQASNLRVTVDTNAQGVAMATQTASGLKPGGETKYLALQNEGTVAVRVAWTAEEMTAGHYFTLYPNNDPAGRDRWQGPVELAGDRDKVWLQTGSSSSSVCVTFFQKRG